jgi:hypothetical protein
MAFDIQAAKAAGYTDDEINAYLQGQPKTEKIAPVAPGQEVDPGEPPPPPPAETYEQAGSGNYMPGLATAGIVTGALGVPAAIGYGIKAGLSGVANKGGQVMDLAKQGVGALQQQAQTSALTESRLQNRPGFGGPAVPTQAPVQTAPMQTAPATPAPQVPQMQAAKSIVQKLALDKILKGAGVLGAGMALGQGLFGTSDEEIATLKAAEARRKAQGQR